MNIFKEHHNTPNALLLPRINFVQTDFTMKPEGKITNR